MTRAADSSRQARSRRKDRRRSTPTGTACRRGDRRRLGPAGGMNAYSGAEGFGGGVPMPGPEHPARLGPGAVLCRRSGRSHCSRGQHPSRSEHADLGGPRRGPLMMPSPLGSPPPGVNPYAANSPGAFPPSAGGPASFSPPPFRAAPPGPASFQPGTSPPSLRRIRTAAAMMMPPAGNMVPSADRRAGDLEQAKRQAAMTGLGGGPARCSSPRPLRTAERTRAGRLSEHSPERELDDVARDARCRHARGGHAGSRPLAGRAFRPSCRPLDHAPPRLRRRTELPTDSSRRSSSGTGSRRPPPAGCSRRICRSPISGGPAIRTSSRPGTCTDSRRTSSDSRPPPPSANYRTPNQFSAGSSFNGVNPAGGSAVRSSVPPVDPPPGATKPNGPVVFQMEQQNQQLLSRTPANAIPSPALAAADARSAYGRPGRSDDPDLGEPVDRPASVSFADGRRGDLPGEGLRPFRRVAVAVSVTRKRLPGGDGDSGARIPAPIRRRRTTAPHRAGPPEPRTPAVTGARIFRRSFPRGAAATEQRSWLKPRSCRTDSHCSNPTCHGSLGSRGPENDTDPLPPEACSMRNRGQRRVSPLWDPG